MWFCLQRWQRRKVVVAPVMPMAGHTETAAGGGAQYGGGEKRRGGEQRGGGRKHARVRPLKRRCVSTEDAHDRSGELSETELLSNDVDD